MLAQGCINKYAQNFNPLIIATATGAVAGTGPHANASAVLCAEPFSNSSARVINVTDFFKIVNGIAARVSAHYFSMRYKSSRDRSCFPFLFSFHQCCCNHAYIYGR